MQADASLGCEQEHFLYDTMTLMLLKGQGLRSWPLGLCFASHKNAFRMFLAQILMQAAEQMERETEALARSMGLKSPVALFRVLCLCCSSIFGTDALVVRKPAQKHQQIGWRRPSLLGWRPSLVGWILIDAFRR